MSAGLVFALAAAIAIVSFAVLMGVVWLAVLGVARLWSIRREPKKLRRAAMFAILGPITGPLYARAERCLKEGKPRGGRRLGRRHPPGLARPGRRRHRPGASHREVSLLTREAGEGDREAVEGEALSAAHDACPHHRLRRSPSPDRRSGEEILHPRSTSRPDTSSPDRTSRRRRRRGPGLRRRPACGGPGSARWPSPRAGGPWRPTSSAACRTRRA